MSNYLVSGAFVKSRIEGFIQLGVRRADAEQLLGCSITTLENEVSFFSLRKLVLLEEKVTQLLGISDIGILLSRECRQHKNARSGLIGAMAASCNTIGEAFSIAVKYNRLLSDGVQIELREKDDTAEFAYKRIDPTLKTVLDTESAIIDTYDILRQFGTVYRVEFEHAEPVHIQRYREVFNCPVVCRSSENKLVFDAAILKKENPGAQPYVNRIVQDYANQILEKIDRNATFTSSVGKVILEHLSGGQVNADFVARELHISRQVLYRKLKEENTSFKALLEETRKAIATKIIAANTHSLSELALILGFSELSAFSRAYKRWFKKSPSA